jgi:hypothetical protein
MIFDRALTDVIRSRRLVEETEQVLSEALTILRTLDGPSSTWPVTATERLAWTRTLDESIRQLMDVRSTLHALLDRSRSRHP